MASRIAAELRAFVGKRRMVRVEFASMPDQNLHGYLMGIGRSLGLMHSFHEFFPDGYRLIRVDDVESVRSGEFEQPWDRMLEGEGLLGGLDIDWSVDLNSWAAAIGDVHRLFGRLAVEWQLDGSDEAEFTIGRVVDLDAESMRMLLFDAKGVWDPEPETIDYDEVLQVHIETPYIQRFWKYLSSSD